MIRAPAMAAATVMAISRNLDSHQLVMPLQPIAAPSERSRG